MNYRQIITGEDKSLLAASVRAMLAAVRPMYALGVAWKNRKYDRRGGVHADVPVISIGNLTLGGTGKTPMVIWLAGKLQEKNHRVAILSRGYHAKQQARARAKNVGGTASQAGGDSSLGGVSEETLQAGTVSPLGGTSGEVASEETTQTGTDFPLRGVPRETPSEETTQAGGAPAKSQVAGTPSGTSPLAPFPLNDEGLEIQRRLPGVAQLQQPDRVASARRAVEEFGADVLVLDDGFQHRRLHRDVDIVLMDATQPFGVNGKLFPSGTLREPLKSLRRADGIVLTRADFLTSDERAALKTRIFAEQGLGSDVFWAECRLRPVCFENLAGERFPLNAFEGKRVGAFCGIGNPEAFFSTLERLGISLDRKSGKNIRTFPDHFAYGECGRLEMNHWRKTENLEILLCTVKDIVKLSKVAIDGLPTVVVFALRTELEFLAGEELLLDCLRQKIPALFD